jgi:hypothetical protein
MQPRPNRPRRPIATTVSADMRTAIEDEAARSGRTMGAVIELWLEQARVLHKLRVTSPGGVADHGRKKKGAEAPLDQQHFPGF